MLAPLATVLRDSDHKQLIPVVEQTGPKGP